MSKLCPRLCQCCWTSNFQFLCSSTIEAMTWLSVLPRPANTHRHIQEGMQAHAAHGSQPMLHATDSIRHRSLFDCATRMLAKAATHLKHHTHLTLLSCLSAVGLVCFPLVAYFADHSSFHFSFLPLSHSCSSLFLFHIQVNAFFMPLGA